MAKQSNISLQGLLGRCIKMYEEEHLTHWQIAEILQSEGYTVSRAGVQRALRSHKLSKKEFEQRLADAQVFVEATKNTPGLQMAKAGTDMVISMLITELQSMDNLEDMSNRDIIDSLTKIVKSQKDIAKMTLDYEKGYKQGLFKAGKELEKAAKQCGVSAGVVAEIKKSLGVE